jgi:LAO/AO transport system kinase
MIAKMDTDNQPQHNSALKVNKGIEPPPIINPTAIQRFSRIKKKLYSSDEFADGILKGNRTILSQAITMIESTVPAHQKIAHEIIEKCLPYSGNSIRIGITGVPGVGKSTFIETFGTLLTSKGHKLAVLAIDPSSERSKGSILGDKTRMERLSIDANAFIRPSPSSGTLGGVAFKTRESVILCEAGGFDIILIETVGVGQSEIAVHSMVDFFLLLMLAGAGDELQGIKRGIMEMADCIVITKEDGNNMNRTEIARIESQNALNLFPPGLSGLKPKVLTCSALENKGFDEIRETLLEYFTRVKESGYLTQNRSEQSKYWMYENINERLKNHFYQNKYRSEKIKYFEQKVLEGKMSSFYAADALLHEYFQENNNSLIES